jgi:AcrR family transcriptional regulator
VQETVPRRPSGRPRLIDREKIVRAASEIGADRLTMRAVAEHLGVTTQALYNHIGGRRELMALLANDYGDIFDIEISEGEGWQEMLAGFARALRQRLLDRPGTAAGVATRGPISTASIRFVDRLITSMGRSGYTAADAMLSYRAAVELVVGSVQRKELLDADPSREQANRLLFYEALAESDPDSLPNLAHIAAGWNRRDPDELFEYALTALIAGARTTVA